MSTRRFTIYHAYEQEIHKIGEYEREVHKIGEYDQETHKIDEYDQETQKSHAYELEILKSHGDKLKILKNAFELKDCQTRNRVIRPNVMTHSCNQLLRIQLTLTEFLLRQERSQSPDHVSLPSPRK